jgi:uncharacterized Rmd1/YagE family protein
MNDKLDMFREFMDANTNNARITHALEFICLLVFAVVVILFKKNILSEKDIEQITEMVR